MQKLSDFHRPLVISGPSGVGKSTLLTRLFAEFPEQFEFSISHTTREPRAGEVDGKHYVFVSVEKFQKLLGDGAFLEHAQFSGNSYGTSKESVRHVGTLGRRCILDIEAQGIIQIKQTDLDPVYLFISPPSMAALRERLHKRGTETEESAQRRLATAEREMAQAQEGGMHDVVVVNDDLERAYGLFRHVALGGRIAGDALPPTGIIME